MAIIPQWILDRLAALGGDRMATIEDVKNILPNPDHVYEASRVLPIWGACPVVDPPILYPIPQIKFFAKENKKRGMDWRLVYGVGHSIRQIYDSGTVKKPGSILFSNLNRFWLTESEKNWVTKPFESGYYFINCALQYRNRKPQTIDMAVSEFNTQFDLVPDSLLIEVMVSTNEIIGSKPDAGNQSVQEDRILYAETHLSKAVNPTTRERIRIGYNKQDGIWITTFNLLKCRHDNGILVYARPISQAT
jgi:hypothetical protein